MAEPRPGQIGSHRIYTYAAWVSDGALVPLAGASADPDLCRRDYIMECSDRWAKPEPRSKQRAAVKAAGGRMKGVGKELRYLDVDLAPWRGNDQYPGPPASRERVHAGIMALYMGGLVTDMPALAAAAEELC